MPVDARNAETSRTLKLKAFLTITKFAIFLNLTLDFCYLQFLSFENPNHNRCDQLIWTICLLVDWECNIEWHILFKLIVELFSNIIFSRSVFNFSFSLPFLAMFLFIAAHLSRILPQLQKIDKNFAINLLRF